MNFHTSVMRTVFILILFSNNTFSKKIEKMLIKNVIESNKLQSLVFKEIKSAHNRVQVNIIEDLKKIKIDKYEFKSILKRKKKKELFSEVKSIMYLRNYKLLGQIEDLIRGRIDVENLKDVKKIFSFLSKGKYVVDYILPFTKYEDYPRYHLVLKDGISGLNYELQIGTKYTSHLVSEIKILTSPFKKPQNFHSLWFKKLSKIKNKKVRREFNLDIFESNYDQLLVATGEGMPNNFKLRCSKLKKLMIDIIKKINKKQPGLLNK